MLIHKTVDTTNEGLHSTKNTSCPTVVIKLDLSKAYNKVSWIYLRLLLLHVGFGLHLVKSIMGCVTLTYFVVLIIDLGLDLFKPSLGLKQGFPPSSYLFLLAIEGLGRAIFESMRLNKIQGVRIGRTEKLTHLLFVDDVFFFFAYVQRMKAHIIRRFWTYFLMQQVC